MYDHVKGYDTEAYTLNHEWANKTHKNGWTITAQVKEDYYRWVNTFKAEHPKYGRVSGDFETQVWADSKEGYADFFKNFPPHRWNYWDI